MSWGGFGSKLKAKGIVKDPPVLLLDAREIWDAFLSLSIARVVTSVGIHPIAYSEILAWMNIYNVEGECREEFAYIIRILDRAYLEKVRAKNAKS